MGDLDHADDRDEAGADSLGRLCRSLLDLLQSQSVDQRIVATTFAPLAGSIARECRETAARLRREIGSWKCAADELQRLSQSPFIHFEAETQPLLAKLTTAQAHASRVVEALEAIAGGRTPAEQPPPISIEVEAAPAALQATRHDLTQTVADVPQVDAESLKLELGVRDAYLERGRARVLQRQPAEAIDDFTRAIQMREDDPEAHTWRGNAHALCGRHDAAVADYSRALELRPDLVLVRYNRAVSLRHAGDFDQALTELGQLIPLKPDHAPIYLNRGLIYLARNNPRLAVQEFKTALVHQPRSVEAAQRLREAQALLAAMRAPAEAPSPAPTPADVSTPRPGPDPATPSVGGGIEPLPVLDPQEDLAAALLASLPEFEPAPEPSPFSSDPEPASPTAAAPVGPMSSPLNLNFECPGCGRTSSIRWDKMERGKILSCPKCQRSFTTRANGELAAVVRDKSGRWVDLEDQLAERHGVRTQRLRITAATGIIALVLFSVFWAPQIVRSSSPSGEPELPTELNPRAERFARAWLAGDGRTLRRLTDPVQEKLTFSWCRQNPAPSSPIDPQAKGLPESVKFEVEALPSAAPLHWLRVHIRGLPDLGGQPELVLDMAWVERGDVWLFQPAPGT